LAISIVIVSYNGAGYLHACIDSILGEIDQDDEIILVDNASTDGSADLVQQQWPQVRLYRNDKNIGFAVACNQGVSYASGEMLVLLNQDTWVQPGWLNGLLAPFEQDRSIGLVTSKLLLMSRPEQIQICGQDIHFTGFSFGRGFLSPSSGYRLAEPVGAVSGASFAIRRELWEQLGGFDAELYMYYEETDLCWRARLAGFSSLYSPDSVVLHDFALTSSKTTLYYSERNRYVLLLKNWKFLTLFLLLPSLILAEMIDWGYMVMVGWNGIQAKLRAIAWLVGNIPTVANARSNVQSSRREPDWVLLTTCGYQLKPQLYTGGWIGRCAVSLSNLWFRIHYRILRFITRSLNI
jgi:GT2 family glycosyltransferase